MLQVLASSGLWEVMTPQEAVDFVHQCRLCRPDNISCSEALTLEAHTRWKLNFSKVADSSNAASVLLPKQKLTACHESLYLSCKMRQYHVRIADIAHKFLLLGQDCRQHSRDPVAGHSCKG